MPRWHSAHIQLRVLPSSAGGGAALAANAHPSDAFNKKDANAVMALYAKEVFVFDVFPPRQYANWDAYK